jgi:hypothetical protein
MAGMNRVIGIGLSALITIGVLLAAAYVPFYLLPYLRQIPPHRFLGLINLVICIVFAWRVIRAYNTGCIQRTPYSMPIERRDNPIKFWTYILSEVLIIAALGYVAWRSFSN